MNPYNDHQAGLFTPIKDHRTGITLYGAAAREYRLMMMGGVTGAQAYAINEFKGFIEPVVTQMQNQMQQQHEIIQAMWKLIQNKNSSSGTGTV